MKHIVSGVEERRRPTILTFTGFYLPGYKGGGPIRSLANMVTVLKDEFDFRIVTCDRDLGDRSAYPGIRVNAWQEIAGVRILYLSPGPLRWWRIARLLLAGDLDLIYLNSFFSISFSMLPIWLRRLGMARRIPVLLAPRGEFSPGALGIKTTRKRCYLALKKLLRLYDSVSWHASTEQEKVDVLYAVASTSRIEVAEPVSEKSISVAPDLPSPDFSNSAAPVRSKIPGSLNVVFVSRICRMKNLSAALQILAGVRGDVHFNVYGPVEDAPYWAECRRLINELPVNVKVDYRGELAHAQVAGVFRAHHLFLLPTRGENFGHAIVEALATGCLVLISDQTPWRQLREKEVGWDLPLDQPAAFRQAMQECIEMGDEAFQEFSRQAEAYALRAMTNPGSISAYQLMFWNVLKRHTADSAPSRKAMAENSGA